MCVCVCVCVCVSVCVCVFAVGLRVGCGAAGSVCVSIESVILDEQSVLWIISISADIDLN